MADTSIRTRCTVPDRGMFHVGNARSLLLNWVVARQSGGRLVLGIEDTDAARSRPEWTEGVLVAENAVIGKTTAEEPLAHNDAERLSIRSEPGDMLWSHTLTPHWVPRSA